MSKGATVEFISNIFNISKSESIEFFDKNKVLFDKFSDSGIKFQLGDLGYLYIKTMPAKKGRNPKTGEDVFIPEKKKICFKASKKAKNI